MAEKIDISVIIPTHNRSDALNPTLEHLSKQDFSGSWEVIVVNNNSTDDTDSVVQDWIAKFPVPLRLLDETKPGPAAARNAGVEAASGDYLVFIDNDILTQADFLQRHFANVSLAPGHWFIGKIENAPDLRSTAFGRYRDYLQQDFHSELPTDRAVEYPGATGANWCMSRLEFQKVGGYDDSFSTASCEDLELAVRARMVGYKTMYDPTVTVIHNDWAIDLRAYMRRQELYSFSSVQLFQKYGVDSPQYEVVRQNSSVSLSTDPPSLIVKKALKRFASFSGPYRSIASVGLLIEKFCPDSALSQRVYKALTSVAIFKGVREGFRRYAPGEKV